MNSILITGAAGFIGSHLVDELLKVPENFIIAVDNLDDYYREQKGENVERIARYDRCAFERVDITQSAAMERLFEHYHPSVVIHLAARPGVRSSFDTAALHWAVNVGGTNIIIDLSRKYGVERFVFASSSSVYGERQLSDGPFTELDDLHPISPYAKTKMEAEQNIVTAFSSSSVSVGILRLFSVYGERMRPDLGLYLFTDAIVHGRSIRRFGDGESLRDYTYVGDVVRAFVLMTHRKDAGVQIFNVGSSSPVSLNRTIELIAQNLQKAAIIEVAELQAGDVSGTWASIEKIGKLGFVPETRFEDGLNRFIGWFEGRNR